MNTGIELIAIERQRQIKEEGFSLRRDENYMNEELSMAASCYALPGELRVYMNDVPDQWPWDADHWKPANVEFRHEESYKEERIRELQKAGALIAAEIDRLNRVK